MRHYLVWRTTLSSFRPLPSLLRPARFGRHYLALAFGLLPLLTTLPACSSAPPELPGLDTEAFRADRRGCAGYRDAHRLVVKALTPRLLGLHEPQISQLFGHPDGTEIGDRGQRVYLYHLTPGPACGASSRTLDPTLLRIRFNALDAVSEAMVME